MTVQKIEKIIYELETSLMTPQVRGSAEKIKEMLAEDFFEFGSSGKRYEYKTGDVFETRYTYSVEDFRIKELGSGHVLATYKAFRSKKGGEKICTLRSSVWRKENGTWKIIFHQGTPAKR